MSSYSIDVNYYRALEAANLRAADDDRLENEAAGHPNWASQINYDAVASLLRKQSFFDVRASF